MGYRVDYQPIRKVRGAEKRMSRIAALTALCLLLFGFVVESTWPRGSAVLNKLFFREEVAVTVSALEDISLEIREGNSFTDVMESFCRRLSRGKASGSN